MTVPSHAGDLLALPTQRELISSIQLRLTPLDMIVQWQRCSVAADFLARWFSWHFQARPNAVHVLSTGLNELVENLAKFSLDKRAPVELEVAHYGDLLLVRTRNVGSAEQAARLAERLERLATTDAEELFIDQLEHTAANDRAASGLGLITLRKDYGAQLAADFTPLEGPEGPHRIEVTVTLDVAAVEAG